MHGYTKIMSSPNNGSGSSSDPEDNTPVETPKRKRPTTSGVGYPKVGGSGGGGRKIDEGTPIPVVLTLGTILKLMVPIFGLVSLGLAFYWQTRTHVDNKSIHLESGERSKLETRVEATDRTKQIVSTIKTHVDLKMRQQRVDQKEQILKVGEELKQQQKQQLSEILIEVKQTRRSIRNRTVVAPSP
jgi:hypothetical protein